MNQLRCSYVPQLQLWRSKADMREYEAKDWEPVLVGKEWWTDTVKTQCVNVWKLQGTYFKTIF